MGLFGPYSYTNSKKIIYYLHKAKGKNGTILYFFSKSAKDSIELPKDKAVIENKATGLPIVKGLGAKKK